jgi:(S)-ureidoglycine aminohydrolase
MRAQNQLMYSRTRVKQRYAVFPLEGIPLSRLPAWTKTETRILAAPVLGAQFVQYLLDIAPGGQGTHKADGRIETFFYLLSGSATIQLEGGAKQALSAGGFALLPPSASFTFDAIEKTQALMLRKAFEPAAGMKEFAPLFGNESKVKGDIFCGDEGAKLQLLIPDDLQYDMAMNIFTFEVGHSLPYVETHVMEHGLYFLQGKGLYFLDDTWMEVEATDFIWMGPYCPQCYYATGPVASKYIYYKNVNRDIVL